IDGRAALIAAHAEAAVGRAVKAPILGEDLRPARNEASEDKRLVVGLAAAVDEEALVQVARRSLRHRFGQRYPLLRQHLRRHAACPLSLPLNCLDHSPVAVAEIAIEKLRQEIEIAPALTVVEVNAFAVGEFENGIFTLLNGPGEEK